MVSIQLSAHDIEVDGIYYNFNSDGTSVSVTYEGNDYQIAIYTGEVNIPASINIDGKAYAVSSIGDRTFFGCSSLTSITIPNSVTSIGVDAFFLCIGLSSVTIPNSVTSIGYSAFYGCSGLTFVTIPNSVMSIGENAFYGCSGLTSVTIPNSVTSIGGGAFCCCSGLTSVTIPNSVTSIGRSAFRDCSGLISVTIPNSVTSIGDAAFAYCSGLSSLTIPNSVTSIGDAAFSGCSGLSSVTVPSNVSSIGSGAFSNCSSLKTFVFPPQATKVASEVLRGCTSLTNVEFKGKVTSIGTKAFESCFDLSSISLPDGLVSIGESAFGYCKSITMITIPNSVNSIGDYSFNGCELTEISVPDNVAYLGVGAFEGCNYIKHVEIGKNVSPIRAQTFRYCFQIESIVSHIKEPLNMVKNAFADNVYVTAKLVVPDGTMNKYLSCDGWKDFVNIIEESQQESFMLTVNCNEGGEVSFNGQTVRDGSGRLSVNRNQSITLTITPDEGFEIKSVTVNGEDVTDDLYNNTYTLAQIKENKTVEVLFAVEATYLSIQQAEGGSVMQRVERGKTYEYRLSPTNGWRIHSVTFNDEDVTSQLGGDNTFTTPVIESNSSLIVVYERTGGQVTAIGSSRESSIIIQGTSFGVRVLNAEVGDTIHVYNQEGKLLYSEACTSNQVDISLEHDHVYIIKVREKVMKVRI